MSNLGEVLSKLVYLNVSQTAVWGRSPQLPEIMRSGAKPPAAGRFFKVFLRFFLEKNSYFSPIGSHFARVHSHLKELDF